MTALIEKNETTYTVTFTPDPPAAAASPSTFDTYNEAEGFVRGSFGEPTH